MPRVMRILGKGTTVASAVVCVATVWIWLRSYWAGDHYWTPGLLFLGSSRGTLYVGAAEEPTLGAGHCRIEPIGYWRSSADPIPPGAPFPGDPGVRSQIAFGGFSWFRTDGGVRAIQDYIGPIKLRSEWQATAPHWAMATVFGLLPGVRLLRRRRRARPGCCPSCGYDLRATPARCPECGHTPEGCKRNCG